MRTTKQISDMVETNDVLLKRQVAVIEEVWQYATIFRTLSEQDLTDITRVLGSSALVLN